MNSGIDPTFKSQDSLYESNTDSDYYEPTSSLDKANFAGKALQIAAVLAAASGSIGSIQLFNFTSEEHYETIHPYIGLGVGLVSISLLSGFLCFAIGAYIESKTEE